MDILIIEDELKTARALAKLLQTAEPRNHIMGMIQSVEGAVSFLNSSIRPDLIFMDVQLADGLCFEIFKSVKVDVPVVFCTAFDDYMMDAFKANGVDYVLKPFSPETIAAALTKVQRLQNFFQRNNGTSPELSWLLEQLQPRSFKKSFLVFSRQKYQTVPIGQVAYFFVRNETTTLVTLDGQEYPLAQTMEEVQQQVDGHEFFRLNRQYLVAFKAIKEVEHYFARKLSIHLRVQIPERLLVGKDKATQFLAWLSNR
ncbi:MAG: response regulator transcription factor [Mucilaginibacter sp.]|nr:response regulator transcription factor [Mucilaginibacter sp.]